MNKTYLVHQAVHALAEAVLSAGAPNLYPGLQNFKKCLQKNINGKIFLKKIG